MTTRATMPMTKSSEKPMSNMRAVRRGRKTRAGQANRDVSFSACP
jgi:hypothetical protein